MKWEIVYAVSIIGVLATQLSAAAAISFKHVVIDDAVKDPWAKIIADIDNDGFADIVIRSAD